MTVSYTHLDVYKRQALPKSGEDALMTAKNKWLIAHEEAGIRGAFNGLLGVNIEV